MNKISPLGAIRIAIFVKYWNSLKLNKETLELKKYVQHTFCSEETTEHYNGMQRLPNIFNGQVSLRWADLGKVHFLFVVLSSIVEVDTSESDKEVVAYFRQQFNEGNFNQIPLPDFFCGQEDIVVERRILSPEGKISVAGPKK